MEVKKRKNKNVMDEMGRNSSIFFLHESVRLDLGTSKIEVLAKIYFFVREIRIFLFLAFPGFPFPPSYRCISRVLKRSPVWGLALESSKTLPTGRGISR